MKGGEQKELYGQFLDRQLKLLSEFCSRETRCGGCGDEIYLDDDHAFTVVAIEWFGRVPALKSSRTLCGKCAAEVPDLGRNPLYKGSGEASRLIPEDVRQREEGEDAAARAKEQELGENLRSRIEALDHERLQLTSQSHSQNGTRVANRLQQIEISSRSLRRREQVINEEHSY